MGQPIDTAFLLTAGVGSRLKPHTDSCPKSTIPFLTIPLCYYSFFLCKKAGLDNYIFNIHYLPEKVLQSIDYLKPLANKISISDETKQILGSGGAFNGAQNSIKDLDAFLVANGDEIIIPEQISILEKLKFEFEKEKPLATLLVTDHPELLKTLKPVWVNEKNEVEGFGMDKPTEDCRPFHFTGYKIYDSKILNFIPEGESNIFYDILVQRISQGDKVKVCYIEDLSWFETGNFSSYLQATRECLKIIKEEKTTYFEEIFRFYQKDLNNWEILENKGHLLFKEKNMDLPKDFQWSGVVCLDQNISIGQSVQLKNVIASSGTIIEDNSKFNDCFLWPRD